MTILTELIVSVAGGVLTAIVLGMFTRRTAPPVPSATVRPARRRSGFVTGFFGFLRVLIAVATGFALAITGGRWLIQNGLLPRGLPTRFGLLIAGTLIVWMMLGIFRRR